MENYLGKIVKLKEKSLVELLGEEKAHDVKISRPFLIVELTYNEKPQLFAIPILTNIKNDFNSAFWYQLPNRLETTPGRCRGLNYSSMFPVSLKDIDCVRDDDRKISVNSIAQEKILTSLILKRDDTVPEPARPSFNFLKKQITKYGCNCMRDDRVNKAYAVIQKGIRYETNRVISEGLSKNENGIRPIIFKAQNYLDNHYSKALLEKQQEGKSKTKMPIYFMDINKVYNNLMKREESNSGLQKDPLQEKYKLTDEQFATAKQQFEHHFKNEPDNQWTLEGVIRFKIYDDKTGQYDPEIKAQVTAEIEAARAKKRREEQAKKEQKTEPKAQEKPTEKKPVAKKKSNNDCK